MSSYKLYKGPMTLQSSLDLGDFGKMWACAYCGPINCIEYTLGRIATRKETSLILGEAVRTACVTHSNFKHPDYVRPKGQKQPIGWGSKPDPNWHYLIEDWAQYIRVCCTAMDTNIDKGQFKIAIMKTQHNTTHYCIVVDDEILMNPDPSLHGEIKKLLRLP